MASNCLISARTPSYLQPTASTAQRVASSGAAKRAPRPPTKRDPPQSRAPLSSGDDTSSKSKSKPSVPKSRVVSGDGAIDRVGIRRSLTVFLFQTGEPAAQPSQPLLQSEGPSTPPEPPHDTLQIAAQVQPWLFMQSNLQDSLSFIRKGAQVYYPMDSPARFPIPDFRRTAIMPSQMQYPTTLISELIPLGWMSRSL